MPRASRRGGNAARRHADTLRFVLFEARPAGLELPQLVRASDLSPSQVRSGLTALKDQVAEKGWPRCPGTGPRATSSAPSETCWRHTNGGWLGDRHRRPARRCPPGRQEGEARRRAAQLDRVRPRSHRRLLTCSGTALRAARCARSKAPRRAPVPLSAGRRSTPPARSSTRSAMAWKPDPSGGPCPRIPALAHGLIQHSETRAEETRGAFRGAFHGRRQAACSRSQLCAACRTSSR